MNTPFKHLRIVKIIRVIILAPLLFTFIFASSAFANSPPPPDQPGPYKVGFTTFTMNFVTAVSGPTAPRATKIMIWYPCSAGDLACGSGTAGALTYMVTIFTSPNPTIMLPSPLGAVQNAMVESGQFPLVIYGHGGSSVGTRPDREASMFQNYANNEVLASHGFIVASYIRNGGAPTSICDNLLMNPREIITAILSKNATSGDLLEGHVDVNKIGAMAASAAGNETYPLTAGIASLSLPPDSRVKAVLTQEGANPGCGITLSDKLINTKPFMVMGGSEIYQLYTVDPFNQNVNATPRILVHNITKDPLTNLPIGGPVNAEHLSYGNLCYLVDRYREESLRLQQLSGQSPLVEPLTSVFPSDPSILDAGARVLAGQARTYWQGPLEFLRGRTFCNRVGTDHIGSPYQDLIYNTSSILSLDTSPMDGFTDVPPFVNTPLIFPTYTACPGAPGVPCIPQEPMSRVVNLYDIAFFKVVLAGDTRYAKYLTHSYSISEPYANVTTVGAIYSFNGFLSPVDNLPVMNTLKAGQAVPIKFSLGGDQGLNILASGYPQSKGISCNIGGPLASVEETSTAGNSSLQYDQHTDTYTYVWKTDKAWKGTCRQLEVKLNDNQIQVANFQFK